MFDYVQYLGLQSQNLSYLSTMCFSVLNVYGLMCKIIVPVFDVMLSELD